MNIGIVVLFLPRLESTILIQYLIVLASTIRIVLFVVVLKFLFF